VDHRADIYAVGALGYEMLCGHPPFTDSTPQAVLAAHITRAPEPLERLRPTVPPQLATLIARCLEKRPADRWQSAAELAPHLEAIATPSAGTTPTATQPITSAASEQAIRRGHPVRVAVLFAAASAVVLAVVAFLMYRFGLPDWVLWGAGALLLIGLPIMVATGLHERRRAAASTTAVITPREIGPGRWLTWRRALLGGVLAFAGLGAVTTAYTAMRSLGIGPVGTVVASGALDQRDPVLLADFENRAGDSTLGVAVTEALRIDLSQSPTIRLLDRSAIADALQRMQRAAGAGVAPTMAREIAERLGAKALVQGHIDRLAGAYVLSATLLAAQDGRVLTAVRETAKDSAMLLTAVDRLSRKLRERIGESLITIRASPPLEQVTTQSLAALRKYSEATRLADALRQEEAVPLLEEAIVLDSGFAMANRRLSVILGNLGGSAARAVQATTQAYEFRDRLTETERQLAIANYHSLVDFDRSKTVAAYRSVLAGDSDNTTALNNLALLLNQLRRWAEGEQLAARAVRVAGKNSSFYFDNLIEAQIAQGHFKDARATIEVEAHVSGGSPLAVLHYAALAGNEGDLASAERYVRQLKAAEPPSLLWQTAATDALASLSERSGRIADAVRYLRELMALNEQRGLPQEYINGAARLADLQLKYGAKPTEALAVVNEALARHPLDSVPSLDRPFTWLALINARTGKVDQARQLLRRFETEVPAGMRRGMWWRHFGYAALAEAEGRQQDALNEYQMLYAEGGACNLCGLYEIAGAHAALGQADSAITYYERAVSTPAMARLWVEGYTLAPSLKRLGELYEQKGDRARAAEYYNRFVDLWKDAEPDLQPAVREVRQRLARLAQEPDA
jgi:tetratricopeptide (TPR) repeat protein